MAPTAEPTHHRPRAGSRGLVPLLAALVLASTAALTGTAAAPAAASGAISEISLPGVVHVLDAVTVPGDAMYLARGPEVVRIVPGSAPQTITLGGTLNARVLAATADGTVWFGGMNGSFGTITSGTTVTAKALAEPTAWVVSLTVGNDGGIWALTSTSGWNHLEHGPVAGPMAEVTLPNDGNYLEVARGGSGAVVLLGATNATVSAAEVVTPLTGFGPGTITDTGRIGTDLWIATTFGLTRLSSTDQITSYDLSTTTAGPPATVTAGPGSTAWYGSGENLGRIGAGGPEHSTVIADTPTFTSDFEVTDLLPDPSANRLWAVGQRSGDASVVPVELAKGLSQVTVDDPGPLQFGVAAPVTAHVSPWDAGTTPTGTVTFTDHGVVLGSAPLAADGTATTDLMPPFQALDVRATYSGDSTHAAARSNVRHRSVASTATAVTITPPAGPWRPGARTFEVRVTSPTGALPTGTVSIGDATVPVSGGVDSSATVTLSLGSNTIAAAYQPDDGYLASNATLPATVARWDTDEEDYVAAAYQRLFNRSIDPSGRTYWSTKIRNGLSRDQFALTQVTTSEYRRTLAKRVGLVSPVATPTQAKPIVDAMATKTVRELLIDRWAANSAVTSCVDGVAPTVTPGTYMCWAKMVSYTFKGTATFEDYQWVSSYGNTAAGRRKVATILVYSDTAVRPLVERAYSVYLGRSPDPGGWSYWTKKIQAGTREERVEAMVLGSSEFYRRTLLPPA